MGEAIDLLKTTRLAAIVQSPDREDLIARALAAAKGGIRLLALPISVPFVAEIAAEISDAADVVVGLSDIVLADQLNVALAAGAEFVISPVFDPELIKTGHARGLDVLPSVTTANELRSARRDYDGMIAIAPAQAVGGPAYVGWLAKSVGDTSLVAFGGIGSDTAPQYLEDGAVAVVVDKGLFPDEPDPEANAVIGMRAEALVELCASAVAGERQSVS